MYEKKIVLLDALVDCQFPLIYSAYINVLGNVEVVSPPKNPKRRNVNHPNCKNNCY